MSTPPLSGTVQSRLTISSPGVAVRLVGAPGTLLPVGVAEVELDAGPAPCVFRALTWKVYDCSLVRFWTTKLVAELPVDTHEPLSTRYSRR